MCQRPASRDLDLTARPVRRTVARMNQRRAPDFERVKTAFPGSELYVLHVDVECAPPGTVESLRTQIANEIPARWQWTDPAACGCFRGLALAHLSTEEAAQAETVMRDVIDRFEPRLHGSFAFCSPAPVRAMNCIPNRDGPGRAR